MIYIFICGDKYQRLHTDGVWSVLIVGMVGGVTLCIMRSKAEQMAVLWVFLLILEPTGLTAGEQQEVGSALKYQPLRGFTRKISSRFLSDLHFHLQHLKTFTPRSSGGSQRALKLPTNETYYVNE